MPAPDTKPRKEGSAPSYSSSSTGRKKKKARASDKENVVFPLGPKLLARLTEQRAAVDIEQVGCLFVEIVLWASCWGMVDMCVNMTQSSITMDPVYGSALSLALYGVVVTIGIIICTLSQAEMPFNIPNKVVEFGGLVLMLSGSWGLVDSLSSLLAGGGSLLILFWYFFFALCASIVLTWHHMLRPNKLLDRLVLS